MPNPNLRPEIGKTKEVGVNLKYDDIAFKGDKLRVKANVFRNDIEDYIELVQLRPADRLQLLPGAGSRCPPVPRVNIPINSFSFSQYQNIGNARIEGVEFEGTYDAGDWFVGLSGQHIRGTRHDQQPAAAHRAARPDRHHVRRAPARSQAHDVGALAGGRGEERERHSGPNKDGLPDFAPVPAYNLVNLYIGYQPTPDILASFSIDNLLNKYYVQYMMPKARASRASRRRSCSRRRASRSRAG